MAENGNVCKGGPKLIFACSGAADVGQITDLAARKLDKDGVGKMFCMAGIGGRVNAILKITESAQKILAIDGCPLNCVKNSLKNAGFNEFECLQLSDLGIEKGKSPPTEENIAAVVKKAAEILE
ncbi:MAG TPA: zinc-binding protein [Planctomycetes bacterium]|nr:zinc-binding protein [Planctomycetota bacterium]